MSIKKKTVVAILSLAIIVVSFVGIRLTGMKITESKFVSNIGKSVEVQAEAINYQDDNSNVNSRIGMDKLVDLQQEAIRRGINNQAAGTISIPAIGINLPIYRGANQYTLSLGAATFYYEDAEMGKGNYVVGAHNMERPRIMFSDLTKLVKGDAIDLIGVNETFRYRVNKMFSVPEKFEEINGLPVEGSFLSLPKKGERAKVTLFTCVYVKDEQGNYVKERFVVQGYLEE